MVVDRAQIPKGLYLVIRGNITAYYQKENLVACEYSNGSIIAKFTVLGKASRFKFVASSKAIVLYIKRRILTEILETYPNEMRLFQQKAAEEFEELQQKKKVLKSLIKMRRL